MLLTLVCCRKCSEGFKSRWKGIVWYVCYWFIAWWFYFFWKKIIWIFYCVHNKNLTKKLLSVSNVWILFPSIEICLSCDDIENVEVEDHPLFFGGLCKSCKVWLMSQNWDLFFCIFVQYVIFNVFVSSARHLMS